MNTVIVMDMGADQPIAVERQHILAAVVALLVTGVKAEAAAGLIPELLHQGGKIFLALYVFKCDLYIVFFGCFN